MGGPCWARSERDAGCVGRLPWKRVARVAGTGRCGAKGWGEGRGGGGVHDGGGAARRCGGARGGVTVGAGEWAGGSGERGRGRGALRVWGGRDEFSSEV